MNLISHDLLVSSGVTIHTVTQCSNAAYMGGSSVGATFALVHGNNGKGTTARLSNMWH